MIKTSFNMATVKIAIVNYQAGNIRSVAKAIDFLSTFYFSETLAKFPIDHSHNKSPPIEASSRDGWPVA